MRSYEITRLFLRKERHRRAHCWLVCLGALAKARSGSKISGLIFKATVRNDCVPTWSHCFTQPRVEDTRSVLCLAVTDPVRRGGRRNRAWISPSSYSAGTCCCQSYNLRHSKKTVEQETDAAKHWITHTIASIYRSSHATHQFHRHYASLTPSIPKICHGEKACPKRERCSQIMGYKHRRKHAMVYRSRSKKHGKQSDLGVLDEVNRSSYHWNSVVSS